MLRLSALSLAVAASMFCLVAASPGALEQPGPSGPLLAQKTLVLVRHAEKDASGDARDPGLSEAGKARAERLASLFASAGVTHLFATEYHRTQDTLAPLATQASKKVEVVAGAKKDDLLRALDALPAGSVALVAGHSNTVPAIAAHFGVELVGITKSMQGPVIPEDAFDRVYVLTLPDKNSKSSPSLLELRY